MGTVQDLFSNGANVFKIACILGGIGIIIKIVFSRKYKSHPELVPARGHPLIGSIVDLDSKILIDTLRNYPLMYGKLIEYYVFSDRHILISRVDLMHEVLRKRPKLFRRFRTVDHFANTIDISKGLFFENGNEEWTRLRKLTAPSFSLQNITNKFSALLKVLKNWITELKALQNALNTSNPKGAVDMVHQVSKFTKAVITVVALGLEPEDPMCAYFFTEESSKHLYDIFYFGMKSVTFSNLPTWLYKLLPVYELEKQAIAANKIFHAECTKIMEYKRQLIQSGTISKVSMLDTLFSKDVYASHVSHGITDTEIIDNIKLFYFAGSDTTSATLTWICYYYALYPEIARRIREEFQSLFESKYAAELASLNANNNNDDATANETFFWEHLHYEDIQQMKYAHAVVKETIRLRTPANCALFNTQDGVDCITLSNGLEIDPSTTVVLNFEYILVDESIYEQPMEFRPERWLTTDETRLKAMESAFCAFGGGTRICPGMNLAYVEATTAAIVLAYYFDMQLMCPEKDVVRTQSFTVSANQMPIQLTFLR